MTQEDTIRRHELVDTIAVFSPHIAAVTTRGELVVVNRDGEEVFRAESEARFLEVAFCDDGRLVALGEERIALYDSPGRRPATGFGFV